MAYPHDSAGGSHRAAARGRGGQGSSSAVPHQALAYAMDDPIVDEVEEALKHAGHTIAVPVLQSPHHGLEYPVHEFVQFDADPPFVQEPQIAPDPADAWAPL